MTVAEAKQVAYNLFAEGQITVKDYLESGLYGISDFSITDKEAVKLLVKLIENKK